MLNRKKIKIRLFNSDLISRSLDFAYALLEIKWGAEVSQLRSRQGKELRSLDFGLVWSGFEDFT